MRRAEQSYRNRLRPIRRQSWTVGPSGASLSHVNGSRGGAACAGARLKTSEATTSEAGRREMRNGEFFGRESTMNQLEQVMYTATTHTTRGRGGAARSERRSSMVSSVAAGAFGLVLITTSSTKAGTSRRGNSRGSSRQSCARRSNHCASTRAPSNQRRVTDEPYVAS
jgi:hypothetical protein